MRFQHPGEHVLLAQKKNVERVLNTLVAAECVSHILTPHHEMRFIHLSAESVQKIMSVDYAQRVNR